jgi:hypothetical protein
MLQHELENPDRRRLPSKSMQMQPNASVYHSCSCAIKIREPVLETLMKTCLGDDSSVPVDVGARLASVRDRSLV